ncbi:30S ribosomal protein S5 [Nanoarchaeota archaeon]
MSDNKQTKKPEATRGNTRGKTRGKPKYKPQKHEPPAFDKDAWKPKTAVGVSVKKGDLANIDQVLDQGVKILEPEIIQALLPNAESELLLIGQSKGKFGGGQRRVFRQTQKKTKEGNKPSFATYAVFGDHDGHVGVGYGKAKETVPAREKAVRNAKLNIIKIRRGCGSWQCSCKEPHSIPFQIRGKCGSVEVKIIPAPKGTGLVTETEIKKMLHMAGVEDCWSKTRGKTTSRINLIKAAEAALKQLTSTKIQHKHIEELNVKE